MDELKLERLQFLRSKFSVRPALNIYGVNKSRINKRVNLPTIHLIEEWMPLKELIKIFINLEKKYPQFEKIEIIPYHDMGRVNIDCVGIMKELDHEYKNRIQEEEEYVEFQALLNEEAEYNRLQEQKKEFLRLKRIFEPIHT